MPLRTHLKELWETKIASCFGGQAAQKGDEQDSLQPPITTSRVSSFDTKTSLKTPNILTTQTFVPVFFIILFLITLCAQHTLAHGIKRRDLTFADYVLEHDTPAIKMVSASNAGTFGQEEDTENDGTQADPAVEPTAASNVRASDDQDVRRDGNAWVVQRVGRFTKRAVYTFDGDTLPAGLMKSDYTVQCREMTPPNRIPYNERFDPANVQLSKGFLNLKVPGGQHPSSDNNYAVSCAEVTTVEQNILYGSIRTTAIFSKERGTCHGIFFYKSDTQEIDIEYLTDPVSQSNFGPDMPIPVWYTNQAVDPENFDKTSQSGNAPTNCTSAVHEYRIDWTKDFTAFYIDGVRQKKYTVNVPSKPGPWVWNNWANGDIGWSVGPPKRDNVFKIKSITMYYNTARDGSSSSDSG